MIIGTALACLAFIGWLYLALFNGQFWRPLLDSKAPEPVNWPNVDIIVPARNEAKMLPRSLASLLAQDYPGEWRVLLVDDHSTDGTGEIARQVSYEKNQANKLAVIAAPDLPPGWSGKVAAMQAGLDQSNSHYVLFTDADIEHPPDSLRRLVARALADKLDLLSLMVKLNCFSVAEKLLIPAFVFFFAMLYPCRRANSPSSSVAAAAGGVMLVKKKALASIGGLTRIKSAIIDDCALARAIKDNAGDYGAPGRIRLTLTRDVLSLRPYPSVADVKHMISRSAFTQLKHSYLLLAGTIPGLVLLFFVPPLMVLFGSDKSIYLGLASWIIMSGIYLPMVLFYEVSWVWIFTLPLAALIYIMATIDSALQYRQGKGGQWKGRAQAS